MDEKKGDQTGRPNAGETAREIVALSLYQLVRLARMGLQAATTGVEKLEDNMARRQREHAAEAKPMGEAPPSSHPTGTTSGAETSHPMGEAGERHQPGSHDPGQSRN